jgi:hypothetical protein
VIWFPQIYKASNDTISRSVVAILNEEIVLILTAKEE